MELGKTKKFVETETSCFWRGCLKTFERLAGRAVLVLQKARLHLCAAVLLLGFMPSLQKNMQVKNSRVLYEVKL
jgi:hypothetical protein